MICATGGKLHWNYFLALERDLEMASRYVEFSERNYEAYSIEFAHLLFAAASEVDVVAKLLCQGLQPSEPRSNINDYRSILMLSFPDLPSSQIFVPRYGLTLTPWDNWASLENPVWWKSYNKVKHERDAYFDQATLKNALNALGALLTLMLHYYSYELGSDATSPLSFKDTTEKLQPESVLLRFRDDYYYSHLILA